MRRGTRLARALLLLLGLPLLAAAQEVSRAVSITFDDLPYTSVPSEDEAAVRRLTEQLLQALRDARAPAVGFVNEAKLYRDAAPDAARVDLLRRWLQTGFELGNHTYSHPSLNHVSLDVFQNDLLQGERVTRALVQDAGQTLRWFRHPFLHQGTTAEVRSAFEAFLASHGYRVAPVTVNNSEWVFAAAYARARAQGDQDAAARIAAAYVPYMTAVFARAEQLALDLFGRPIPHVLVLHANALNADHFADLATALRERGYRFISLDEALADRAYARAVSASALVGESWLECWARAAGLRPRSPPAVPGFVTQGAGPAAVRGY